MMCLRFEARQKCSAPGANKTFLGAWAVCIQASQAVRARARPSSAPTSRTDSAALQSTPGATFTAAAVQAAAEAAAAAADAGAARLHVHRPAPMQSPFAAAAQSSHPAPALVQQQQQPATLQRASSAPRAAGRPPGRPVSAPVRLSGAASHPAGCSRPPTGVGRPCAPHSAFSMVAERQAGLQQQQQQYMAGGASRVQCSGHGSYLAPTDARHGALFLPRLRFTSAS